MRIPNTFANHYPPSFFSFYLKEHYYTVHGIGERETKAKEKWDKIFGERLEEKKRRRRWKRKDPGKLTPRR